MKAYKKIVECVDENLIKKHINRYNTRHGTDFSYDTVPTVRVSVEQHAPIYKLRPYLFEHRVGACRLLHGGLEVLRSAF